ncbi:hypothetical protein DXG03_000534 [Asterophora parasitica]|uniref:GATA-type domain-containing protein n=1 Tax=Asterophora parasitica TaxID=117018 RepID=A0A9P7G685_9AGAR|nr:hypothetical protein DXG03_000534 [Asterophora parasitica]
MVDTDNARSKREFKKLSKCMGDKLDKEKGRSIEELEAPDFKANHSTDMIRQRAEEKERNREASQHALPGTIKRMQFTFSVDQPSPAVNQTVQKPDLKPSPEFNANHKRPRDDDGNDKDPPRRNSLLRFPSLFSSDFGPSALLYPTPTLTTSINYGEGLNPSASHDRFSISRPTIELPLDELLDATSDSSYDSWNLQYPADDVVMQPAPPPAPAPVTKKSIAPAAPIAQESEDESSVDSDDEDSDFDLNTTVHVKPTRKRPAAHAVPETVAPTKVNQLYDTRANTPVGRPSLTVRTQAPPATRSSGPGATATTVNSAVLRNTTSLVNGNSAPGGVKAECSNCGATHTPLWRRGLNDELNCNACGLYCKLHKRPRPKSMRNTHGEGRAQVPPRQETVDVMGLSSPVPKLPPRSSSPVHRIAQCYNCHTTATPLWRKDDEGKTVCNACGLYYKLHGSARPISMKSDVIRKRSRHDARRGGSGGGGNTNMSDTPSASPGVSRRASPAREEAVASPTLAPDSTTQMSYDYTDDFRLNNNTHSELLGALGGDPTLSLTHTLTNTLGHHDQHTHQVYQNSHSSSSMFNFQFPGPYHPDYLPQLDTMPTTGGDPLPFAHASSSSPSERHHELQQEDPALSPRTSKRRRMSTDSASEPPSSASGYSSYNDGGYTTSATSASSHSQRSSMDFPFSTYMSSSGPALRGSGNTFWHPPMMPQGPGDGGIMGLGLGGLGGLGMDSPHLVHPPMLPPDESPMDYLHQPMQHDEDLELFSSFLHPPMTIPDAGEVHPPMLTDWVGEYGAGEGMRAY